MKTSVDNPVIEKPNKRKDKIASAKIFGEGDTEQIIWFEYELTEKSKGVIVEVLRILTPLLLKPTDLIIDIQTSLEKELREEVEVKMEENEMLFI